LLGPGPLRGLFLASGHFRNGILLAPITATVLRDLVLQRTPAVDITAFRAGRNARKL
jgi:glycine oxidase